LRIIGLTASFAGQLGESIARITVEDCLEHEENRFALTVLATRRARLLLQAPPGLVPSKNRESVTSVPEIAAIHGSVFAKKVLKLTMP